MREQVEEKIAEFIENQRRIFEIDLGEQAISSNLKSALEPVFREWDLDCEYNRNQEAVKRLTYAVSLGGEAEERDVVPDIIVHKRHTQENYLAIEVKKTTNRESSFKDLNKLRAFKEQLGYTEALFVRFKAGSAGVGLHEIQWVE